MPVLTDRARVVGGLPDVVTIQEGKVSLGHSCPHFFHTGKGFQCSKLGSHHLHHMPWLLMPDFSIATYKVQSVVSFPLI